MSLHSSSLLFPFLVLLLKHPHTQKIRKPINQIQKKNHRRNRHKKTKHIRNWNLGFLFDKAQVVNCFGGGCSWVSQCRLFWWRCCCGSKKSLREGSERKVKKWEWKRVAMAHEREQSNWRLQRLQVWFVFCDNSVERNLGCQIVNHVTQD